MPTQTIPPARIEPIIQLIRIDDLEKAFAQTRALLSEYQRTDELISLDLIESEWSDLEEKSINGLLSVDDGMRLSNINREKLIRLLRNLDNEESVHKTAKPLAASTLSAEGTASNIGNAFKNGIKNLVGVLCLLSGLSLCFSNGGLFSGLFMMVAGLVATIPTLLLIEKALGRNLPSYMKYIVFFGAIIGAIATTPTATATM